MFGAVGKPSAPFGEYMKKNKFEKELPQGYEAAFTVDAESRKTAVLMNVFALVITAILIATSYFLIKPTGFIDNFRISRYFIVIGVLIAYIVLHELVHGIAYKYLTKQKLKFGITFSAAYCGVPDIYVYRNTALVSLLAPLTVFSVLFILSAVFLKNEWDKFYALILFSVHFGSCSGDIYDTLLYLFRFKDNTVLMRDTGPKQTFYVLKK